jgi:hypothetical protein
MKRVRPQITMCDFIYGGCKAVRGTDSFLTMWLATKRNPCSACVSDKLQCAFYHELVGAGVIVTASPS